MLFSVPVPGSLDCASFVAGITEAVLNGCNFVSISKEVNLLGICDCGLRSVATARPCLLWSCLCFALCRLLRQLPSSWTVLFLCLLTVKLMQGLDQRVTTKSTGFQKLVLRWEEGFLQGGRGATLNMSCNDIGLQGETVCPLKHHQWADKLSSLYPELAGLWNKWAPVCP